MEPFLYLASRNHKPRVSIISIALKPEEFSPLVEHLKSQKFQDFEFVGEAGGTIPEAWNRAIQRSRGEILVFTETDAHPVDEYWLEEMVNGLDDTNHIVKGLEITSNAFDFSNLAAHRSVFLENPLDHSSRFIADIELLSRLRNEGYMLVQLQSATVVNLQKFKNKHYFKRSFLYGYYWSQLKKRYTNPIEIPYITHAYNRLLTSLLQFLGLMVGSILFLPERWKRDRAR